MSLSGANHLHFIQTVKNGIVEKILNIDSHGSLVFKALKDIYDCEDTNRRDKEKIGRSCSVVEKKSKKRGIDYKKFDENSENGEESDLDDINFGKITLKQLKKQSNVKRKITHVYNVTVKEECADSHTEKDKTDLNETISSWKSKKPKGKKRSPKKCAQTSSPVKSKPIMSSESCPQFVMVGLRSAVKVEVSETECSEPMVANSEACDSSVICSEQVVGFSGGVCSKNIEDVEYDAQAANQLSLTKKSETCAVNGFCYDNLEVDGDGAIMGCPEMTFPQSPNSPFSDESTMWISVPKEHFLETTLPVTNQSSDLHTSDSVLEISSQANQISGVQEPAVTTESTKLSDLNKDNYENTPLDLKFDSLSSPQKYSSSSPVSTNCSNREINLVCDEDDLFSSQDPTVISVSTDTEREYSPEESPVVLRNVLAVDEENQNLRSPPDKEESDSPDQNQHCDSVCEDSVSVTGNHNLLGIRYPPERLLSTRKVISPVSQERLRQAMRGVELIDDEDHYKCKGKLQFENATENEPSTKEQGAEITKVDTNTEGLGALRRSKVTIKSKRNTIKKNSPPKTRSLPNFSTGTKSLQKLSESAIAFSQRQMHDFECLATKLMHELNSMKGIVEGKLHPETSTEILKYDVDEVKLVIKSAKKAEETTRKWLSVMTRDCNRFCTIMKLSEKGEVPSPDKTKKERRNITFADEAGGVLCHVKVFEDGMACLNSQR